MFTFRHYLPTTQPEVETAACTQEPQLSKPPRTPTAKRRICSEHTRHRTLGAGRSHRPKPPPPPRVPARRVPENLAARRRSLPAGRSPRLSAFQAPSLPPIAPSPFHHSPHEKRSIAPRNVSLRHPLPAHGHASRAGATRAKRRDATRARQPPLLRSCCASRLGPFAQPPRVNHSSPRIETTPPRHAFRRRGTRRAVASSASSAPRVLESSFSCSDERENRASRRLIRRARLPAARARLVVVAPSLLLRRASCRAA